MQKEYRYRRFVRWAQYLILSFGVLLGAALALETVVTSPPLSECTLLQIVKMFIFPVIVTIYFLILSYLLHRMARTVVFLEKDKIVWKCRKKEKQIRFDIITQLKFHSFLSIGGWMRIVSNDGTIRTTLALENAGDFIRELMASLDTRGLSDLYDRERLLKYMKTAAISDRSWARFGHNARKIVFMMIVGSAIGYALSSLGRYAGSGKFLWVVASVLWPIAVFAAMDIVIWRHDARTWTLEPSTGLQEDSNFEKKVFKVGLIMGVAFYLCAASVLLGFKLTGNRVLWEKSPENGQKAYEKGQYAKAEDFFMEAVERAESFGSEHQDYAMILRKMDRDKEAEEFELRAAVIMEKYAENDGNKKLSPN